MAVTLALDLGTRTGYAIRTAAGGIDSGSLRLDKQAGPDVSLWRGLWSGLALLAMSHRPTTVVIERPIVFPGRVSGARVLFGLAAVVELVAEDMHARFDQVSIASAKKAATGSGKAKKHEVRAAVQKLYPGITPSTDDEADALAVLYAWEHEYGPMFPRTR